MIRAVIFDMDGVLIDTYHAHYQSWRRVAEEYGVTFAEHDFARTFGRTSREIIRLQWTGLTLSDEQVQAIDDRKEAVYRDIVARDFPAMDGARELIDALRAGGFRLAVGSSAPPENVELAVTHLGGPRLFDAVVHGRDVTRGKPDPQVFLLAAGRMGLAPGSCAVIEDAAPGVEAARRAGMASVALMSTGRTEAELRAAQPMLIVRSLRELTPGTLSALVDGVSA